MKTGAPIRIVTLVCERDVPLAQECLGSLEKHSSLPIAFHFFEDGTLSPAGLDALQATFPRATFTRRTELDERAGEFLRERPQCRRHRQVNPTMLKVLDLPAWFADDAFLFCDADVLFLRPFSLGHYLTKAQSHFVFMQDRKEAYSARIFRLALDPQLAMPSRLNSGLMSIPPHRHDLDFVEWFLSQGELCAFPQVVEQTIWAAMTRNRDVLFFDPAQVVCASRATRVTSETVAIHFPSHFKLQMPRYRTVVAGAREPAELRLVRPRRLGMRAVLVNGLRNRFGRW